MIGAGPAGLAAGYFLARAGHPVTLFEREANAGGVVKNIIPQLPYSCRVNSARYRFCCRSRREI
ncbi:FAD-dependent oxidoreductase [Escherichia coli]